MYWNLLSSLAFLFLPLSVHAIVPTGTPDPTAVITQAPSLITAAPFQANTATVSCGPCSQSVCPQDATLSYTTETSCLCRCSATTGLSSSTVAQCQGTPIPCPPVLCPTGSGYVYEPSTQCRCLGCFHTSASVTTSTLPPGCARVFPCSQSICPIGQAHSYYSFPQLCTCACGATNSPKPPTAGCTQSGDCWDPSVCPPGSTHFYAPHNICWCDGCGPTAGAIGSGPATAIATTTYP
ncbi:hypothetical protein FA15DRAFT_674770 [Coprinopsis marcescibilis]|uniref:Uncharacterized protein n=1 Tax=Coprinopsis marcescibilis TaxID=230819 RepID=A0A5C3KGL9_COPMA|nr:hypothetical protein FA15DRAFT_674770 [Coprinopsis marcescibilis]